MVGVASGVVAVMLHLALAHERQTARRWTLHTPHMLGALDTVRCLSRRECHPLTPRNAPSLNAAARASPTQEARTAPEPPSLLEHSPMPFPIVVHRVVS
jgi:hypothetical protein